MPKLTIDGQEIEVEPGTSIIQAAEMLGIEIPRFCYHDKLSVPANCRMCLVEVKGGPQKPQASCALACADGMEVETQSEMVQKARKGVMEFLLINHPLDCPICDQGGECDLQDQAVSYGFDRSRYHENKRAVKNKELGPLVKTIMTRCIHCTRCVRFGEEIAGVSELGLLNRGEDVEIGTFIDKAVSTELSGNLVDVCPVGALTSKPYAFQARSWELDKTDTIDVHDAVGSNIQLNARNGQIIRILPRLNESVNEEWINDRTRYAYDGLRKNRLDRPYLRNKTTGKLEAVSWEEALAEAASLLENTKPASIAALAGDLADVESMVALKDLLDGLGVKNYDCRADGAEFETQSRAGYLMNTSIEGLEDADAVILIGTHPRWEGTMINARIRKAWVDRKIPVGYIGPENLDHTYPAAHIGTGPGSLDDLVDNKSDFAKILKKAKKPVLIAGMGVFQRKDGKALHRKLKEFAEHFKIVKRGWNGFNILHNAAGRVGGLDIGFTSAKFDLRKAQLVYLLGADTNLLDDIPGSAKVIYQGHHGDAGAHRADIIFPAAAYSEKTALYVNTEGRVQSTIRAVHPPGEAKEDWQIIVNLAQTLEAKLAERKTGKAAEKIAKNLTYRTLFQLRERVIMAYPHFGQEDSLDHAPAGTPSGWKDFSDIMADIPDGKISDKPFILPVDNFYITNVITRHSAIMAECSRCFAEKKTTLAEAAE